MPAGFSCISLFKTLNFRGPSSPPLAFSSISESSQNNSQLTKSDLHSCLFHLQEKPKLFINTIFANAGLNIYQRLFLLEHLLDEDYFVDTFVNLGRDTVDLIVPYELQNVRAYFYYLSLKSRIREHKATHCLPLLTNRKLYSYSFEKIMAELRNNVRFGGLLLVFLSYCRVNISTELSVLVFQKRIDLFEGLYEESVCLLLFTLVHFEDNKLDFSSKEILAIMKSIKTLADKYSIEIQEAKPGIEFQDNTKKITRDFLNPIISLLQKVFFVTKKTQTILLAELNEIDAFVGTQKEFRKNKESFFEELSLSLKRKIVRVFCEIQKERNQIIKDKRGVNRQALKPLFWDEDRLIKGVKIDPSESHLVNAKKKVRFADEETMENELIKSIDFEALKGSAKRQIVYGSCTHI